MPEQYSPKHRDYPLSQLNARLALVRVSCRYCKRTHCYQPSDLIQLLGDVDVDSLAHRMKCENGADHGFLNIEAFTPTGREAVGLKIRRLMAIKVHRVPVWREDPA